MYTALYLVCNRIPSVEMCEVITFIVIETYQMLYGLSLQLKLYTNSNVEFKENGYKKPYNNEFLLFLNKYKRFGFLFIS